MDQAEFMVNCTYESGELAIWELRNSRSSVLTVVERLGFGRRYVTAVLVEVSIRFESVHPVQRRDFHTLDVRYCPQGLIHSVLVQPVDSLGGSVVVTRPGGPDRKIDTDFNKTVSECN